MDRFDNDPIVLTDEEGKEQSFEIVDTLEEGDQKYIALLPYTEDYSDEEEEELVILKVDFDANGEEDGFSTIDDEDEYQRIGNLFIDRLNSLYDDEQ